MFQKENTFTPGEAEEKLRVNSVDRNKCRIAEAAFTVCHFVILFAIQLRVRIS